MSKDIEWCPQHGYPLPCAKCGLGDYEWGKRDGIKEVIGKIETHTLIKPDDDSITRFEPFYQIEQAELKKWEDEWFYHLKKRLKISKR